MDPSHGDFKVKYTLDYPSRSYVKSHYQELSGRQLDIDKKTNEISNFISNVLSEFVDSELLNENITFLEENYEPILGYKHKRAPDPNLDYNIDEIEKLLLYCIQVKEFFSNKNLGNDDEIRKQIGLKVAFMMKISPSIDHSIYRYVTLFIQNKIAKLRKNGCDDINYIEELEKSLQFLKDLEFSIYDDALPDDIATIVQNEIVLAQKNTEKNQNNEEFNAQYIEKLEEVLTFLQKINALAKTNSISEETQFNPSDSSDSHTDR